ncbi:MAG: hypothetical protein ABIV51_12520 [Saprospiraceae bacterium]
MKPPAFKIEEEKVFMRTDGHWRPMDSRELVVIIRKIVRQCENQKGRLDAILQLVPDSMLKVSLKSKKTTPCNLF